jgi:hypothetical protein
MRILRRLQPEAAQDTLEYMLVVAALGIPLVAALLYGFSLLIPEVVEFVCPSIDTGGAGGADRCF